MNLGILLHCWTLGLWCLFFMLSRRSGNDWSHHICFHKIDRQAEILFECYLNILLLPPMSGTWVQNAKEVHNSPTRVRVVFSLHSFPVAHSMLWVQRSLIWDWVHHRLCSDWTIVELFSDWHGTVVGASLILGQDVRLHLFSNNCEMEIYNQKIYNQKCR